MFEVEIYRNKRGDSPISEYLERLKIKSETSKDARVKLNKIVANVRLLAEHGTRIGEPVTKHLDGEIWELRPLKDRILYFFYNGKKFVLLHYFVKKTQKTPKKEIDQAKRNMIDYINQVESRKENF